MYREQVIWWTCFSQHNFLSFLPPVIWKTTPIRDASEMDTTNRKKYWRTNLKYLVILLFIWFLVSYGFGILWVDQLNTIQWGGFKLGFWFAQQGSIYVFVILIFIDVRLMNRLDRKYKVDEWWIFKLGLLSLSDSLLRFL